MRKLVTIEKILEERVSYLNRIIENLDIGISMIEDEIVKLGFSEKKESIMKASFYKGKLEMALEYKKAQRENHIFLRILIEIIKYEK